MKKHLSTIIAYTDGSLMKTKQGIIAGYGIYFPNSEIKDISMPLKDKIITNNRAEFQAIHQALIKITKRYTFDEFIIYTDSQYCQKSLTQWINNWKQNNWRTSANKSVENQDKIKSIDKYMQKYNIIIKWIPAHTNNNDIHSINNAKADTLAKQGAKKLFINYLNYI